MTGIPAGQCAGIRDGSIEIFVPPVPNDSGSAIGTAIEAQFVCTGSAKVRWGVYNGPEFTIDTQPQEFVRRPLDYDEIADLIANGQIIAWVCGRAEIGPRALGNRSLLAAPFSSKMRDRLDNIKNREWYRPIAPVCLEADAHRLFGIEGSSPHMLYFGRVAVPGLDAVMHVDGSARVQTVNENENENLHMLFKAFKRRTGFGVLCNTSLNRKGSGFFSRGSDLFAFASEKHIETVVIDYYAYFARSVVSERPHTELS